MVRLKITVAGLILAGLTLSGGGRAANAAEHPPFAPTRDVTVAYELQLNEAGKQGTPDPRVPRTIKMIYSASVKRMRIEQPSMPGYLLIDRAGGHLTMVMDEVQSFMDMPFDAHAGAGLLLNEKMAFTRVGTDKVAGLECTLWDVVSDRTTARLCITADGVILRGDGSDPKRGHGKLVATSVSYGTQPESMFRPPAGFHRMEMPALPPGLGGKPGKSPG